MDNTVKKGTLIHYILIFALSVSASQTSLAQFAFEIPKRTTENFMAYSLERIRVNVSGKLALCSFAEKGTILLDVSGGKAPYTFQWNTLETTEDRYDLTAGTYTVNITDAEGEKHTEQIVVWPPYPLTLNQINTKDATCGSIPDGYAKISLKNGKGENNKISWSNGLKDVWETSNLAPGTYSVTVSDISYCDVTVSFEIKCAAANIQVTDQVQSQPCSGQTEDKIDLRISSVNRLDTYKYNSGLPSKELNSIDAGDYQVQIKNQKGKLHASLSADPYSHYGRPWFRQRGQDIETHPGLRRQTGLSK